MVDATWNVVLELAPWLLLGAALAGVLHVALPRDFVRRHLSGRRGVLKAVALGVPLPLCSCGVIPAGLGLKRDGASDGAALGFLISTPQTGVDSVLVSAGFLGWPFAIFKLASAAVMGLVGGWLVGSGPTPSPAATPADATPEASAAHEPRSPRSIRVAVAHGVEILRSIWRWLAIGVLVSAAITVWVPPAWLQSAGAAGPAVALGAALGLSLPLYVCATASVPIAAALVAGGFPPGAALVFLMAGPATNIATIGAVHRGFGRRVTAVYLTTIIVGSLGLGYAFDFVVDATAATVPHQHAEPSFVAVASGALLVGMVLWFGIEDIRGWWRSRNAPADPCDSCK